MLYNDTRYAVSYLVAPFVLRALTDTQNMKTKDTQNEQNESDKQINEHGHTGTNNFITNKSSAHTAQSLALPLWLQRLLSQSSSSLSPPVCVSPLSVCSSSSLVSSLVQRVCTETSPLLRSHTLSAELNQLQNKSVLFARLFTLVHSKALWMHTHTRDNSIRNAEETLSHTTAGKETNRKRGSEKESVDRNTLQTRIDGEIAWLMHSSFPVSATHDISDEGDSVPPAQNALRVYPQKDT